MYQPAVLAHHDGPVGRADPPPRVSPPVLGLNDLGIRFQFYSKLELS